MEEFKLDIDMQSILRVLLKYWGVLLICAILGGLAGWSLSKWVFSPVYESSVTIFACEANDEPNTFTTTAIKSQALDLSTRLVNDYKEIITSRKVSKAVSARVRDKFPGGNNSYSITSDLQRNTRILKISVSASSPELAQFAAATTAEVFSSVVREIMNLKNIQIVDVAELPTSKVRPKPGTNTATGFFVGLLLALAACLVRELLDWTIKIPEEIPERIGKNVIGTIPEAKTDESQANGQKNKHGAVNRTPRFFITEKNNHAVAEAFKILRANIEFMVPGRNKSKIVMFTSALPGEGKSTIIANLALSMCESGKKVIILDCDLRRPFMHKFFSVDNARGLVSIIVGATPSQDAIHRHARGDKGLDLLSSGPVPPNPTELLMTDEFKQLLGELSQSYDYIFIDAPPTLNMADTTILGHLADASIFIITAGKTRIELIKRCLRQLSQTNIEVNGILLNRFNIEAIKYSYYYYYHYHYNYNYNYSRTEQSRAEQSKA